MNDDDAWDHAPDGWLAEGITREQADADVELYDRVVAEIAFGGRRGK